MKKYVTIDIGGTMMKYGLIDEQGQLIEKNEQETEAYQGGKGIMQKVCAIIEHYQTNWTLDGICLSSAGTVDPIKGEIFYSGPAIPNYAGTQFKPVLEKKYGLSCEIENDVNCAGLAEVVSGSAKGSSQTLCLTIGTGIGGCMLTKADIFHGYSNSACEVGYLKMAQSTFQELASTTALVQAVAIAHGDPFDLWNGKRVFQEAKKGNIHCITAIDQMVDYLGQGIATICYVINPETIVLGGGIMAQKNYLAEKIQRALTHHLLPSISQKTKLVFAQHKNDAGMLGAYYHFSNQQCERKKAND